MEWWQEHKDVSAVLKDFMQDLKEIIPNYEANAKSYEKWFEKCFTLEYGKIKGGIKGAPDVNRYVVQIWAEIPHYAGEINNLIRSSGFQSGVIEKLAYLYSTFFELIEVGIAPARFPFFNDEQQKEIIRMTKDAREKLRESGKILRDVLARVVAMESGTTNIQTSHMVKRAEEIAKHCPPEQKKFLLEIADAMK